MIGQERLDKILAFCTEFGEEKTLSRYEISIETLHRYQREGRFAETRQPKILLLDIETARMWVGAWRLGKQHVGPDQIIKDWFMFGWCAKWLFNSEMMSEFVTGEEAVKRDDGRICKTLWALLDSADVVITHNGNAFDVPKINTRFIINHMIPPSPFQTIDTCLVARKQFAFSSNSLNYLSLLLHSKEKLETDYKLWIRCENGEQEALDYMEKYCGVDVTRLEEAYLELRPYIKSHPNVGILMDAKEMCCPNCGSFDIEITDNYYTTPANQYRVVRCKSCGAPNRLPTSVLSNLDRKRLVRSVAR